MEKNIADSARDSFICKAQKKNEVAIAGAFYSLDTGAFLNRSSKYLW